MPELTDRDRGIIAKAEEWRAIREVAGLRDRYGAATTDAALTDAWGESSWLVGELLAIITRPGS